MDRMRSVSLFIHGFAFLHDLYIFLSANFSFKNVRILDINSNKVHKCHGYILNFYSKA
jgi:hypothetical protein